MLISICETEGAAATAGFKAKVSFDGGADYALELSDPFAEGEEARLEWYFEEHLRQPFLNGVMARQAAESIKTYGEKLFAQVFAADHKLYGRYLPCREQLADLRIEIQGSPAFQALHWEAMKDPELPLALALEAAMVRRRRVEQAIAAQIKPAPALRVLVVTARPHGDGDVAYRTISRPLVEAARRAQVPVDIDILRPGTYRALEQHLQAARGDPAKGGGFYHLIHFDTHGALLSHAQLQAGGDASALSYRRYGRGELAAYDGQKAFLFFEGEDGGADPVEAGELAALLTSHQIPISLLNACQSGKQVGESETSLGSRLIEAGAQLVLAMAYSITVSAAEILMTQLYRQLFDGKDVAAAIRSARRELHHDKLRRAHFNQNIALEDWLLPVVYQNQPLQLQTREFTPAEDRDYWARQAASFPLVQPAYGFLGRDLDILAIERRLLQHNLLLVRGMGGAGKTTLLKYLGHWWQATDFVDKVFYFGYDEQGYTCQQIQHHLAKALWGEADYHARFAPLPPAAQQAKLAQALRGQRHLLLLDNLESITGSHLAIAHGLMPAEQAGLREFLAELSGGQTMVLLGSRGGESWLAAGTFKEAVHELRGLDPEAASQLAESILERYRIGQRRQQAGFEHLLKLLDGFPLALEVVLPNLAKQSPDQVLAALQAGGVELDSGDSHSKTESIVRCIDYAHGNLAPEAQLLLECLAPFSGVINTEFLPHYTQALRAQDLLAGYPFERWPDVLREAGDWGLLSPLPEYPALLRLQPVLPYFLRRRLNDPGAGARKARIEAGFCRHYDGLGEAIFNWLRSNDAEQRSMGQFFAKLEYENLLNAVQLGLAARRSIWNPYIALSRYLDTTHGEQRGLTLGEQVLVGLQGYPAEVLAGPLGFELAVVIDDIAKRQLILKRFSEAEAAYRQALDLCLSNSAYPPDRIQHNSAGIYHQLGIVAQAQRQWPQAEQYFRQALDIFIEFNDRHRQASAYHQLGIVAQKQRQWPQAEQYYRQALDIFIEFNDRYKQAGTFHQLGSLAEEQRQWQDAEQYYRQALDIFIEFNDRYEQADTFHQLGSMAEEQRQWPQAEQYYRQALEIYIEFNDRYGQADTFHQLGCVAEEQRQWSQAEQYFRQALDIFIEFNDRHRQTSAYHQLGIVAQEQRQWPQAEQYYRQALDIKIEFNDRHGQASTYHQLGRLAEEQRQWPQAEQYYRQALDIYSEFDDRPGQASPYHHLGTVALEQRQWPQAEQYYRQALDIYSEFDDRHGQASPYHQLGRVAEEQRQWPQAEQYYRQALDIKIEFNDRYGQASTYHQLGRLAEEQRQWPQAEQYYRQALDICSEFNDRYLQARSYHHLGTVALEQRQWPQAEQYYRQALDIYIEFNDRYLQASPYHQLGRVAEEQRQWSQAEQYYRQALDINIELNNRNGQASPYNQLGRVAKEQRQWSQAEQYFRQALDIFIEFNDRHGQASTYHQLGRVAEEQRQWPDAMAHFLTALEIFGENQDAHSAGIVLRSLARLWLEAGVAETPEQVAARQGISPAEAEELLRVYQTDE